MKLEVDSEMEELFGVSSPINDYENDEDVNNSVSKDSSLVEISVVSNTPGNKNLENDNTVSKEFSSGNESTKNIESEVAIKQETEDFTMIRHLQDFFEDQDENVNGITRINDQNNDTTEKISKSLEETEDNDSLFSQSTNALSSSTLPSSPRSSPGIKELEDSLKMDLLDIDFDIDMSEWKSMFEKNAISALSSSNHSEMAVCPSFSSDQDDRTDVEKTPAQSSTAEFNNSNDEVGEKKENSDSGSTQNASESKLNTLAEAASGFIKPPSDQQDATDSSYQEIQQAKSPEHSSVLEDLDFDSLFGESCLDDTSDLSAIPTGLQSSNLSSANSFVIDKSNDSNDNNKNTSSGFTSASFPTISSQPEPVVSPIPKRKRPVEAANQNKRQEVAFSNNNHSKQIYHSGSSVSTIKHNPAANTLHSNTFALFNSKVPSLGQMPNGLQRHYQQLKNSGLPPSPPVSNFSKSTKMHNHSIISNTVMRPLPTAMVYNKLLGSQTGYVNTPKPSSHVDLLLPEDVRELPSGGMTITPETSSPESVCSDFLPESKTSFNGTNTDPTGSTTCTKSNKDINLDTVRKLKQQMISAHTLLTTYTALKKSSAQVCDQLEQSTQYRKLLAEENLRLRSNLSIMGKEKEQLKKALQKLHKDTNGLQKNEALLHEIHEKNMEIQRLRKKYEPNGSGLSGGTNAVGNSNSANNYSGNVNTLAIPETLTASSLSSNTLSSSKAIAASAALLTSSTAHIHSCGKGNNNTLVSNHIGVAGLSRKNDLNTKI